jgi:multiple sugar transport system substrate-binding protein
MKTPTYPISLSSPFSRRRFLQYTGAATAGGTLLAACGGSGSNKTTLTQMYHQYGENGTQQAALRYAKQYSDSQSKVNVKVSWVPGDYATKLSTVLLGSQAPDIFEYYAIDDSWVKQGLIAPLNDLYTPQIKSDFDPHNLSAFTIDGNIYGVKELDDTEFLYYRKSMLDKANIDPASLTSIDALLEAANKLTTSKIKGLFVGNDGGIGALYTILIFATGGDILANNQIVFDTPEVASAYSALRTIATSKATLTGAPTDYTDPSVFVQGLAAMQWSGLWAMPAIQSALGSDFGIIPWPAFGAKGKPAASWGGWAAMVYGKGKHVEEAKALVKYLWIDNTSIQQDWCLNYGFHVPPRKSAAASATKLKSGMAAEAVKILYTYGRTVSPLVDTVMFNALQDAATNIVKNNADAATQVGKAAQTCRTELQKLLS